MHDVPGCLTHAIPGHLPRSAISRDPSCSWERNQADARTYRQEGISGNVHGFGAISRRWTGAKPVIARGEGDAGSNNLFESFEEWETKLWEGLQKVRCLFNFACVAPL